MGSKRDFSTTALPTEPGFYWITEPDMPPHIVEVVISCDSRSLWQVLLPGDPQRYPLDLWDNVLWHGPIAEPE